MFKPNTLIVLGAAASKDFGFPLGSELKKQIADLLAFAETDYGERKTYEHNNCLFRSLQSEFPSEEVFLAARMIAGGVGLTSSIDNFLEMRKDEPIIIACAKAAIAWIILKNEQNCSPLQRHPPNRRLYTGVSFDKTWVQQLAQICFERVSKSALAPALRQFSIISFNYDRCVQQFIRVAIENLYSLEAREADEIASSFQVIHPYGSLGALHEIPRGALAFGHKNVTDILSYSKAIRTFTEQEIEKDVLRSIRNEVSSAERIVFLGFGYHAQNIELLTPRQNTSPKHIIGTARGLANSAKLKVQERLRSDFASALVPNNVELFDMDCGELLEEHRLSLIA